MSFACDEALVNRGKYFPMKYTGHMTKKFTLIFFFDFLGLFVALA